MGVTFSFGVGGGWSLLRDWSEIGADIADIDIDLSGVSKTYLQVEVVARSMVNATETAFKLLVNGGGAGVYSGHCMSVTGTGTYGRRETASGATSIQLPFVNAAQATAGYWSYYRFNLNIQRTPKDRYYMTLEGTMQRDNSVSKALYGNWEVKLAEGLDNFQFFTNHVAYLHPESEYRVMQL